MTTSDSAWLQAAIDYVPAWLAFQVERHRQPGCSVAIAQGGTLVMEAAFGSADLRAGKPMTPRHRLRIASHSKTFTAAGILLLREQGRLGLDDPVGRYVDGLHPGVAGARIGEVLSHGAGITRDGDDSGQFMDRRPFLSRDEVRAGLAVKQPLAPGLQLKYSNHGYALLGLLIEQVTGTAYADWITRNVIVPAGLRETVPDMPQLPRRALLAKGHSTEHPFGRRLVIPGDNVCDGMAPAAGFIATAADVARFFAQLDPQAKDSILSPASRREMQHRRWRDAHSAQESHYGLGTMSGGAPGKEWYGHTGGLQGFVSRTSRFAASGLTISVLTNALDGLAYPWVDGIAGILDAFRRHGAPTPQVTAWRGRWWTLWGATDLVPMGKVVCQVAPALLAPFDGFPTEIAVKGPDAGVIHKASGYHSPGQPVRLVRGRGGKPRELWLAGSRLLPQDALVDEVTARYRAAPRVT